MKDYLLCQKDVVEALRAMFALGLWDYIQITYGQTRDYEGGLELAEYLQAVVASRRGELTDDEFERWDSEFVYLKLSMLDHLNRWREYIEYFRECYKSKQYRESCILPGDSLEQYAGYIIKENGGRYVHFLYRHRKVYAAMQKKWKRWAAGKKVGNQLRHQQDKLSDQDIKERLEFITVQLDHHMARLRRQR